jgi:hypothetical protein
MGSCPSYWAIALDDEAVDELSRPGRRFAHQELAEVARCRKCTGIRHLAKMAGGFSEPWPVAALLVSYRAILAVDLQPL